MQYDQPYPSHRLAGFEAPSFLIRWGKVVSVSCCHHVCGRPFITKLLSVQNRVRTPLQCVPCRFPFRYTFPWPAQKTIIYALTSCAGTAPSDRRGAHNSCAARWQLASCWYFSIRFPCWMFHRGYLNGYKHIFQ